MDFRHIRRREMKPTDTKLHHYEVRLEELWLKNNSINIWKNVEVLKENKSLKTLNLEHRLKLKDISPWLGKIYATLCL
uniref:Uncharacterized protein n=1 Tax=Glossina palpalis gambiensis TaxID=67801 RepID=A0A1B0C0T6_9MUSC